VAATIAAPIGLLLVRLSPTDLGWAQIRADMFDDRATYLYLIIAAMAVCVGLGAMLGYQADTLLARSTTDELTGLENRWAFQRRLDAELARSVRYRQPVSVVLVDLDGFKTVNDRWGHLAGDRVLHAVGQTIRSTLRSTDQGARLGGDEFAIVAPGTDAADAWMLAHRASVAIRRESYQLRHPITASIGIATYASDRPELCDRLSLVNAADTALYDAKRCGGNCVHAAGATGHVPSWKAS
jgi:diguanylate cyclase (GGDEF)-like protein